MSGLTKYTFHNVELPPELTEGPLAEVSPLILKILYKRGFQTQETLSRELFGELDWSLEHVHMMDTDKAVDALEEAVRKGQRMMIYQDYDVDGCAAGALCQETLRALGATVDSYVNDREADGYSLCKHGFDSILEKYPDTRLILTVDNGIVAGDAIAYARSKGLRVIVTDHHAPGDTLPEAEAVIDPKRADETYPFKELCGTAVAFKLMLALYRRMGRDETPVLNTLDIVALATVADVVPLVGENRDLVREGLLRMNQKEPRPAFRVMRELFNVNEITAQNTIAYYFAPLINALSRMGEDPYLATQVLLSDDDAFLRRNITHMMEVNKARKAESAVEEKRARALLDTKHLPNAIILRDESFREGIVGIVAGRLKSDYHRPVLIFAQNSDGSWKGSCRSIPGFHMKEALDKVSDLLAAYGGHAMAAGLTVRDENFDRFQERFLELAADLKPEQFIVTREVDAVLDMDDATVAFIREMRLLEPFGEGCPPPLFGLRYNYNTVRFFGDESQHVKYWNRAHNLTVIDWRGAAKEHARQAQRVARRKAIGVLELNEYNGAVSPQFQIVNS